MSTPTAARTFTVSTPRWYYQDGTPCMAVPTADGKRERRPDIRDAKKLGLLPSVTSILQVLDKPGLNRWKEEQCVLAALTSKRMDNEPLDEFVYRILHIDEEQKEEAEAAADKGKQIHKAIADFYAAGIMDKDLEPIIMAVTGEVSKLGQMLSMETPVVSGLFGYAGTRDALVVGSEAVTILDYKTTKGNLPVEESWFEHRCQTAAYAAASKEPNKDDVIRTANIYISTTHPGEVRTFVQDDWQNVFEKCFLPALQIWKFQKGMA